MYVAHEFHSFRGHKKNGRAHKMIEKNGNREKKGEEEDVDERTAAQQRDSDREIQSHVHVEQYQK